MGIDVKSFYLCTPMDRYEYMKMPLSIFPEHIKRQYNMEAHALNGFVYLEILKAIYGLPQGGILANKLIRERLAPHGYYEVAHTPGLWCHVTRPIEFSLVVDDFGVKYVNKDDVDHLITSIKSTYKLTKDWTGNLYCGITLDWDYTNRKVHLSMPGYVQKALKQFQHKRKNKPQHAPYPSAKINYGAKEQYTHTLPPSPALDKKGVKQVQEIVGALLFYTRAIDSKLLV